MRKALPQMSFGAKRRIFSLIFNKFYCGFLLDQEEIHKRKNIEENSNTISRVLYSEPKILENEEKIHYNDMVFV